MTNTHPLKQAQYTLQRRIRQLKDAESRLDVAQRDIAWFSDKVDADQAAIGECWFDLMISGISHRQYLQLVLEHDDEKLGH